MQCKCIQINSNEKKPSATRKRANAKKAETSKKHSKVNSRNEKTNQKRPNQMHGISTNKRREFVELGRLKRVKRVVARFDRARGLFIDMGIKCDRDAKHSTDSK